MAMYVKYSNLRILDHTISITKQNSTTYKIIDWRENNPEAMEKISW